MQATAHSYQPFQQSARRFGALAECFTPLSKRGVNEWTLEQLNIQPYQQILEVSYGTGAALQETARALKVGFLAGVDPSVQMYQSAYKKNKKFIRRQLLQLHLGEIYELPYPSHYFHTIYGINAYFLSKDPEQELLRLAALLKNGGKMVLVLQPRRGTPETAIHITAENLQTGFEKAGLTRIRIESRKGYPACIAAIGFKI